MKPDLDAQATLTLDRSRFVDFFMLTKPELTFLAVLTTLAGFYLGSMGSFPGMLLLHTLLGTALVGGGAGALNQVAERKYDVQMRRTVHRPIPSGRVTPGEAVLFGALLSGTGVVELAVFVNVLTAFLSAVILTTYLFLYTPLKRITPSSTLVGAIPGALPPVMGWTAASGDIGVGAWILFGILFFWQMPHFYSLAWVYRQDYGHAGYRIISVEDHDGARTARSITVYSILLLAASLLPPTQGIGGALYLFVAFALGIAFLGCGLHFLNTRSDTSARRLFSASLLYLPALLAILVLDALHVL